MNHAEIPHGFAMGLTQNEDAANTYAMMTQEEKKMVLEKAQHARSQSSMQKLIQDLAKEQQI